MALSTPTISFDQENIEIGEMLELTCYAQGGPGNTLQWFKDGMRLRSSQDELSIETNVSQHASISSTLTIDSLSVNDQGNYTCVVRNAAGKESHSEMLLCK